MKISTGTCFKCGAPIVTDRRPTSLWTQRGYRLENGDINFVALCRDCRIESTEYDEASKILGLHSPIIGVAERNGAPMVDTYVDILKDAQDGKCFYCGKPIGEHYAISGGHISCEKC